MMVNKYCSIGNEDGVEKIKRASAESINWPYQVSDYEFDLTVPLSISVVMSCMKNLQIAVRPSEVVFVQIDNDTYRFHITTRALRSHLVSSSGYVKHMGTEQTQLRGKVVGDLNATSIFGITLLIAMIALFVFASLWAVIVVGVIVIAVTAYCRDLQKSAHDDQERLLVLIRQQFVSSE